METLPQQKSPLFNFDTQDLPNEKWLPIFGFEDHAMISQFGRVKRLRRLVNTDHGLVPVINSKEKILRSKILPNPSLKDKLFLYQLVCTVFTTDMQYVFNVMRMVYYAFKGGFDYHDENFTVVSYNGNDLDLTPDNLRLIYTPDFKASIHYPQPIYIQERRPRLSQSMTYTHGAILRKAKISCYNLDGVKVNTFENVYHAHLQSGHEINLIVKAITEPLTLLGSCYWRNGRGMFINTSTMRKNERKTPKEQIDIQLTQFDLSGNPINHFYSTAEAATANKISESGILECLHGKTQVAGYFLWRYGNWETPITGL